MLNAISKEKLLGLFLFVLLVIELITGSDSIATDFDPFGGLQEDPNSSHSTIIQDDEGPIIPQVEFVDSEISIAFKIISDVTGWSIFPTSEVSRAKVSLWAKDISAKDLLDMIVNMASFIYHRENRLITVMTYEEYMQFYGLSKKVMALEYGDSESVAAVVKPFLTKLGKCAVHKQTNSIILFETKANLQSLIKIVKELDIPFEGIVIEVIDIKHADAEVLARTLQEAFSNRDSNKNTIAAKATYVPLDKSKTILKESKNVNNDVKLAAPITVGVYAVGRSNQLIIKGFKLDIDKLKKLVEKLDIFVESTTRNYHFIYIDAAEVHQSLQQALGLSGRFMSQSRYEPGRSDNTSTPSVMTLIEKTNSIVVSGSPSIHRIMTSIIENADVPMAYDAGSIRIYKLENANAEEVAAIIRELIEEDDDQELRGSQEALQVRGSESSIGQSGEAGLTQTSEFIKVRSKVSVSKSANSVIVQATTSQHRELEKLVSELDKRRTQVLLAAFIVEVITTDNLDIGIELDHFLSDRLVFTSFGLSLIDPSTGDREIIASPGGTAAILRPKAVRAIIQALKSDTNAKITSTPQILVNDNATGFINSVAEEPVTQINAGETVATTSFAGFVEAGTQFQITPHISENGYVSVKYQITLNSFGMKTGDSSVPPPRNTSSIRSEATVPDGFTIVVGGLQTVDESEVIDKVPLLGDLPLIGQAFKSTSIRKQYKTTYLFMTPSIMKNTDFGDLKEISQKALKKINNKESYSSEAKSEGSGGADTEGQVFQENSLQ